MLRNRSAVQAARLVSRSSHRSFHRTGSRLGGHYPEGPLSNLPFNPRKPSFVYKYWGFCFVGFGLPFAIAVWQTYKNH
ncbi:MAG: hypothetical protein M1815_003757 [Lichina confinis]|nr:MAG: hypothetical protein M1815_003757 [Lichina confinis]